MKFTLKIVLFIISNFLYNSILVNASSAQIRPDFVVADSATHPSIRIGEEGNLYAVWKKITQLFIGEQPIYFAIFDSLGYNTQAPARVSVSDNALNPRLAISGDYATIVWWIQGSLDADKIEANVLDLSKEIVPRDIYFEGGDTYSPDVAYLNDTTFVVVYVWEGPFTQSDFQIYGQIATNSLIFQGGHILLDDPKESGVIQGSVRVVARPAWNDFLVVWRDDRSGSRRVYGRFFTSDGSAVDSSFLISEDPELTNMWFLSVAVNDLGEFGVVWGGEIDSTEWVVQLRRLGTDGMPLSPSVQVNSPDVAGEPVGYAIADIAFDRDGTSVIVWEHKINNVSYIYAQRFLDDGSPLGENFKVSMSEDSLNQFIPSVLLRNSKIYTSWSSGLMIWANIIDFYNPPDSVEKEETTQFLSSFYLHQNFPNPFNPVTNIRYSLPERSDVTLVIYSIIGEEIRRFSETGKQTGYHEFVWDASNAASGIYLYRLRAGDFIQTKKMLLLK